MEDDISVTGMSGRFPNADNVDEYWEKLCNKADFITDEGRRWIPGVFGLPKRMGLLNELDKFDNLFFGMTHKLSHEMDPQARILLEVVYESIVDAGYDPETLKGKNIGVFLGTSALDNEALVIASEDMDRMDGHYHLGYSQAMLANRISYSFDFKGPSMVIDTACAAAASALYNAVHAIRRGDCDAAIVASSVIHLRPETTLAFNRMNMLSADGKCKSFDSSGDGYATSEAVVSLFLQRSNDARRKYATVVHIKTNTDGYKPEGITFPSAEMQVRLLRDTLQECNLDPCEISYFEAHAPGTKAGDPVEYRAIKEVYCCNRKEPLLVGVVKSNIGHTVESSGLCSIVKILLAMKFDLLPPNLHFNEPIEEMKPDIGKEVKVITELTPWMGAYAASNSFGLGGVNVHTILKRPILPQEIEDDQKNAVPQLLLYCGRTEESIRSVFKNSSVKHGKRKFYALLHKLAYTSPKRKPYRGYRIFGTEENIQDIKVVPYEKRPVWYVFSGLGTQWPAMAKDLMQIEIFRNSIRKSEEILKDCVPDLVDLLINEFRTENSAKHNENSERQIVAPFVSIAAVQIALVDTLKELGLKPDGIIGHSVGELGCAYADGCFTAEQMLLAACFRGRATETSNLIQGSMAATGMTWKEAEQRCPEDIYPACHNAEESVTISGPSDSMKKFIRKLNDENIFVREVNGCGFAYHSKYVLPAAESLRSCMEKIIPVPKERSSRWISSSYPQEKWKTEEDAKYASASYFVNNLISPVLFRDAVQHIPKNAVVIEIGPHQAFQSILKPEIGTNAVLIGLMKRNANNILHLLSGIGKMYTAGLDPDIEKLYTPVVFPVPRDTPLISPLMKWDHSETWTVCKWDIDNVTSVTHYEIDLGSMVDRYLLGHCIDGRTLFPASGYVFLIWKTFSKIKLVENVNELPIALHDVRFLKATLLSDHEKTKFTVLTSKTTGYFEISTKGNVAVTGFISSPKEDDKKCISDQLKIDKDLLTLKEKDIYKEIWLRGYEYGTTFRGIKASDFSGSQGILNWNENWIVYLDTMFQFMIISTNGNLRIPTGVQKLIINPLQLKQFVGQVPEDHTGVPIKFNNKTSEVFTPGVYAQNIIFSEQKRRPDRQRILLEEYNFVPYIETSGLLEDKENILQRYNSLCTSLSEKLSPLNKRSRRDTKKMEHSKDNYINMTLQSDENGCVLQKCLSNILEKVNGEDLMHCSKGYVQKYVDGFESDILHEILLVESLLRTAIDIVVENTISRTLNVFEITGGSNTISSKIDEYLSIPALYNMSYTILHPKVNLLLNEKLPTNTKVITWNGNSSFKFEGVDLFIFYYLKKSFEHFKMVLENALACLKDDGFILILAKSKLTEPEIKLSAVSELAIPYIPEDKLESLFKDMNLNVIYKRSDSFTSTLYLLRKCATLPYKDSIIYINVDEYSDWVDKVKENLKYAQKSQNSSTSERLWLVSKDSPKSGIIGLVNCIRQEPGGENVRCIFIRNKTPKTPEFSFTSLFYKEQVEKNLVMNVLQNGSWGSYRHFRCKEDTPAAKTEHAYLNIRTIGDLSTLEWINSSVEYAASIDMGALCYVYYASLNFKDVMIASGRLPKGESAARSTSTDSALGFEFSGRMPDGRRVMGMVSHSGMATSVANPLVLYDVPDEWSLEEAATIPVAYGTAYYALILKGRLRKGERILIHSGSGGVGQAAITIALSMGCDVYTTVGSEEKKKFLLKKFPEVQEDHIFNSRDTSFRQDILNSTNGKGVQVVLNSLAEEKLFASLDCLDYDGRFLEIGRYDIVNDSNLGMSIFKKNISFHGIKLDTISQELFELVKNGVADGIVKPLNTTVFNYDEAEKAFRYMASGRHTGKVVLKIREEETQIKALPSPIRISALKQILFDPRKSYIIIGGLGGMGLELTQWLIERGAKYVVLSSRSGLTNGYQKRCLQRWEQESARVLVSKLNVVKPEEAKDIIMMATKLGPVGGIFNLALVLRDGLMENQDVLNFQDVCDPKVESTKNMDLLSRELCKQLDWFVCFSSLVSGRGNAGQCNYGYANSVMERICEERRTARLPGLAIQWGPIADVGIVSETMGHDVIISGTIPQRIRSCLTVLEKILQMRHPVVTSFVPYELSKDSRKVDKNDIMTHMATIFGINDISSINPEANMRELGMDSLMAVELRQVLETNYDKILSFSQLQQLKVKDLKSMSDQTSLKNIEKEATIGSVVPGDIFGKFDVSKANDLIPSETIVPMNAITDGVPLFLIHPAECSVAAVETLAKLLPCPVYGVQATLDIPRDSIENLASWYWKHIKELNVSMNFINLAGYSYGAMIAFEMVMQAEKEPKRHPQIQNVIFLEGSHNFTRSNLRVIASSLDEDSSNATHQTTILYMFTLLFPKKINWEENELSKFNSPAEGIKHTVKKVAAVFPDISSDTIESAYHLFASLLKMSFKYDPKNKLKKDIHLIKASNGLPSASNLSELYDLDKVCDGKITADTIYGTHQSILQGTSAEDIARLMKIVFSL